VLNFSLELDGRMTRPQTAFPIDSYIPQFDGLRGLSILAVFIAHSEFVRALPHAGFLEYGRLGVDLFFVLSGFLITGILLDSRENPHYFRNFYARRVLRIWPLYYLLLMAIFLVLPLFVSSTRGTARHTWPFFVLYIQNLFVHLPTPFGLEPTWSLAIEEQFYITWPLLVALLRKRTLALVLLCTVAVSLSLRIIGYEFGASLKFVHNFTFCRLDAIAFGSLSAIWLRSKGCTLELWNRRARQFMALGLVGVFAARLLFGQQSTVLSYTLIAICFTSFLGVSLTSECQTSLLGTFLTTRALRYVGKISYGLYLLHMPIFLLVGNYARQRMLSSHFPATINILITLLQFGVAFAAAATSWRFFETPILRLKALFPSGSRMKSPQGKT
jgi:peptidoglycan/LPS O-acetylase OafA/YrhL